MADRPLSGRTARPDKHKARTRTPWGSISRERIVSTAVRALDEDGYDQVTIRGLAAEMGVAPMSLYRHVKDKNDLLNEVVDRLLAKAWRPRADPDDWKAWITEASDKLRAFLVTQPAALHVYLTQPMVSPSAIARMEAMTDVLRRALLDEQAVQRAYAAIQTYTIGFAALEAARSGWDSSQGPSGDLALRVATYTTPQQFAVGFHYLLEGVVRSSAGATG